MPINMGVGNVALPPKAGLSTKFGSSQVVKKFWEKLFGKKKNWGVMGYEIWNHPSVPVTNFYLIHIKTIHKHLILYLLMVAKKFTCTELEKA